MKNLVFFDIGGVLIYPIHSEILNRIIEISHNKNTTVFSQILDKSFLGYDNYRKTLSKLSDTYSISLDHLENLITNVILEKMPNQKITTIIRELAQNTTNSLGIISDLSLFGYRYFVYHFHDILHLFEENKIFFSFSTGHTKKQGGKPYLTSLFRQFENCHMYYIDDDNNNIKNSQDFTVASLLFHSEVRGGICDFSRGNSDLRMFLQKYCLITPVQ